MKEENDKIVQINVEDILPNRFQPRLAFDEKELNELSQSIIKYGVIQPIVLRKIGDKYEIIAGERRYKATVLAGLKTIPAIINNTDDNTSAEIALLENLQRKNLTVIEEAQSFKKLMDKGFTQEDIASKLGVSQSSIANKIRLLNLPKIIQEALLYNKISERHARSLLSLENTEVQIELLNKIINEKMTVRQTEDEISKILNNQNKNDIPKNVIEFLDEPEEIKFENNNKEEIKPEVLKIDDNFNIKKENINLFQTQFENNIKKIDEELKNKNTDFYDKIIEEDIKNNKNEYVDFNVKEEVKNKNIPSLVTNIRNHIKDLDSDIKITELDLIDRYQIIIDIEKNPQ